MLSSLDYTLTKIKHKKVKQVTFTQNWNITDPLPHISLQLSKGENFIWHICFPILLKGNFNNWKYLFLWSEAIEFKCILFIIFLRVCWKIHFSENPRILKSVYCLQCKSICQFLWDRGLYWTGFSNNYCLTTENLDAQNTTTDKF